MAVSYKNLALGILQEISAQVETLDEEQSVYFSKQLCAFYQFVTHNQTLPMPPEEEDSSLHIITLGVLMNHFLKNETPRIPDGQ